MQIYDAINDPYCYPNSNVLINKGDLREMLKLDIFQKQASEVRFKKDLPEGDFGVEFYKKLHFHLFQDVYEWAGKFRTVRISKGGSMFCYPEHIETEMIKTFNNLQNARLDINKEKIFFINTITDFLTDLNAIHPFREGNGRTQMTLFCF